jgi:23S rRNA pseudouridine2605 synthase
VAVDSLRINRYLARCGLGSRRAVEALVLDGRVRVNGQPERELSRRIIPDQDVVTVDGSVVRPAEVGRVVLLHKPTGVVSSLVRQDQRPCLLDLLPEEFRGTRLFHVGRLDQDSSGLLLLSDDGDLAQGLLHPSNPVYKVYRVRVKPSLSATQLSRLEDGSIVLDERAVAPARVRRIGEVANTAMIEIALREGRNRQLRRMVEAVGGRVLSLERIGFGPVALGDLASGELREATDEEYRLLRELIPTQR